jgi:hypothetical protein
MLDRFELRESPPNFLVHLWVILCESQRKLSVILLTVIDGCVVLEGARRRRFSVGDLIPLKSCDVPPTPFTALETLIIIFILGAAVNIRTPRLLHPSLLHNRSLLLGRRSGRAWSSCSIQPLKLLLQSLGN